MKNRITTVLWGVLLSLLLFAPNVHAQDAGQSLAPLVSAVQQSLTNQQVVGESSTGSQDMQRDYYAEAKSALKAFASLPDTQTVTREQLPAYFPTPDAAKIIDLLHVSDVTRNGSNITANLAITEPMRIPASNKPNNDSYVIIDPQVAFELPSDLSRVEISDIKGIHGEHQGFTADIVFAELTRLADGRTQVRVVADTPFGPMELKFTLGKAVKIEGDADYRMRHGHLFN